MAKRNLNDLLYFAHVARAKSFTRAAAQLGLTQSALSQAMSNLEEHLGDFNLKSSLLLDIL